jgi:hypothetical protein
MTPERLFQALGLPASCVLRKRLPKNLLEANGVARAGDKQAITNGIAAAWWLASLKPASIGVAEYHTESRSYVELAVLHVELKPAAKVSRLINLLHAALPHPALLLVSGPLTSLSLVHKRITPGNGRGIDSALVEAQWPADAQPDAHDEAFAASLSLGPRQALELPPAHLGELYERWIESVEALLAARRCGRFGLPVSATEAMQRRTALADCNRLEAQMAQLRAAALRERQMVRLAVLNQTLQAARSAHQLAQQAL